MGRTVRDLDTFWDIEGTRNYKNHPDSAQRLPELYPMILGTSHACKNYIPKPILSPGPSFKTS